MRLTVKRRAVCAGCTVLAVALLGISASAIDVRAFPKPPVLYSESAILMDADTGQVLYGKQERKRMYPASLTKILTCLLVMENGRYKDQITVTQEGSSAPVVGTTHIALTEGEQLTIEQLTYAMMVQSANDAANSIALHLGGSFAMFARMMNEAAVQAGAQESHFVNPSGLPDEGHYTTAYDLALITRAAMQQPDFSKFMSAKSYVIPPTNKNEKSRSLSNGNYMFNLNDTYEGAFAGKTGWTQEAGHTLMTVAERDGVTLICIVMKSAGVVDAQYQDSTALFDYGFNHFRRVTLGNDRFPTQQAEYTDASGQTQYIRLLPASSGMPVLLPVGVEESDLKVVTVLPQPLKNELLARIRVEIRVPEVAGEVMGQLAGSFPVKIEPVDMVAEMASSQNRLAIDWKTVLQLAGITLLALLVAGMVFLLILRKSVRLYYRVLLRGRCRKTHLSAEECYYFATRMLDESEFSNLRERCVKERNLFGVCWEDFLVMRKAWLEAREVRRQRRNTTRARHVREEAIRRMDEDKTPFVWKKEEAPHVPTKPASRPVTGSRQRGEKLENHPPRPKR